MFIGIGVNLVSGGNVFLPKVIASYDLSSIVVTSNTNTAPIVSVSSDLSTIIVTG